MTVPMMRRAALGGWQGVSGYPNALTTGPAAGGYTPNTAVTISSAAAINNSGNPSWVGGSNPGPWTVSSVNFSLTGGFITVNATAPVTFQGCNFSSSLEASTTGQETVVLAGGGTTTFEYCSMFGADGTGATRVGEVIDQSTDCTLTVDHCNIYNMRQAIMMASGTSAGITITNNYLHDVVEYQTTAPPPIVTWTGTGGSIAAGTYNTSITYTSAAGECIASPATFVATTGSTSVIVVNSPPALTGQTNWFAYVTQAGAGTFHKQQSSGSPTAIGTNYTLTTTPTTTGSSSLPDIDHSEPIYGGAVLEGGANITITGNTILNGAGQTAAIYLHPTMPFTAVTITNNFLAGGTYTIYCGSASSTSVVIQDNAFSTAYFTAGGQFGTGYPTSPPPFNVSGGNVWTANTWFDGANAGATVPVP